MLGIKYPSTSYFTFSPSVDEKDKMRDEPYINLSTMVNMDLVFTIKMDGSNVMLDSEKVAARNGISAEHKSFDPLKSIHAIKIKNQIPENLQIFGEWLFAKHSIHYIDNLSLNNYLMIFGIYDKESEYFLDFNTVQDFCKKYDLSTVPVITEIKKNYFIEKELQKFIIKTAENIIKKGHEGIVVRNADSFKYDDFGKNIAKYVRKNHVQTDIHWKQQKIVKNYLVI